MSDKEKPGSALIPKGGELAPKTQDGFARLGKLMNDSGTHMVLHEPGDFSGRMQRIERGEIEDGINLGVLGANAGLYVAVPEPYEFSVYATGRSADEAVANLEAKRDQLMDLQDSGAKHIAVRVYLLTHTDTQVILSPYENPE